MSTSPPLVEHSAAELPRGSVGNARLDESTASVETDYLAYPEPGPLVRELSRLQPSMSPSSSRRKLPWYKRPSVYWVFPMSAGQALCLSMVIGPLMEILTRMSCRIHRPDIGGGDIRYPGWRDEIPTPKQSFSLAVDGLVALSHAHNSSSPPTRGDICDTDTVVQQGVTSVLAALTMAVGLIVVFTMGWWSSRSDLWGRKVVSCVIQLSGLVSFCGIIFVTAVGHNLPGKQYWWLLITEVLSACLGGPNNAAPLQAYLADTTQPNERARFFAALAGVLMSAVALGPILGAKIVQHTNDLLGVYFVAVGIKVSALLVWAFIIPESISKRQRSENIKKYDDARRAKEEQAAAEWTKLSRWQRARASFWPATFIDLLRPLAVLLPHPKEDDTRREWGLTFVATALFVYAMASGVLPFILQLGKLLFTWDSADLGYWLSLLGFTRGLYLLAVFPLCLHFLKPKPPAVQLEGPEEQLHGNSEQSSTVATATSDVPKEPHHPTLSQFDLNFARVSFVFDIIAYSAAALSRTENQFIGATMFLSLGAGGLPSIMSLALVLAPNGEKESGKVLGAIAVIQSLGAEVIGSLVAGAVYHATVATFPRAILVLCTTLVFVAFACTMLIRIPRKQSSAAAGTA